MTRLLLALLLAASLPAAANETVTICYDYGCAAQADIVYGEAQLREIAALLAQAESPAAERALLAQAVGRLLGWAGEQSPVKNDRGGNYADDGVDGRMDCIDHSTSTTRLLRMLEGRGLLNWHRVLEPRRRVRVVLFQHFSAVIEELPRPRRSSPAPVVAVPDHVPMMLALCNCQEVVEDVPRPPVIPAPAGRGEQFVVDSWFVDNGQPAVILPLAAWLDAEGASVE